MLGAPEILDGAVGVDPDPLALDQRALAVVPLVTDVQDGVVVELHREVVPHAAHHVGALPDAVALGLPHRPDAPGAIAAPVAAVGGDGVVGPRHREGARPEARLGQALGVEDHPPLAAQVLAGLGHGGNVALPGHVHGHAVLGRVDHDPQAVERLEHLYAERARPTGRPGRSAASTPARCAAPRPAARRRTRRPRPGSGTGRTRRWRTTRADRVHVEVVAVVEVAIAGARMRDELRRLMNGEIVP